MIRFMCVLSIVFALFPLCFAGEAPREVRLDWQFQPPNSELSFTFQRVQLVKDSLRFEILAHNKHPTIYQCIYVTAGEKVVLMDDDLGNEYKGARVAFAKGLDNKLALNQRKTFYLTIPAPDKEATAVNLHFGFILRTVEPHAPCDKPQIEGGYNLHQFNWDVSWIREGE